MLKRKKDKWHLLSSIRFNFFRSYLFSYVKSYMIICECLLFPAENVACKLIGKNDCSKSSFFVLLPIFILPGRQLVDVIQEPFSDLIIYFGSTHKPLFEYFHWSSLVAIDVLSKPIVEDCLNLDSIYLLLNLCCRHMWFLMVDHLLQLIWRALTIGLHWSVRNSINETDARKKVANFLKHN